MMLQGKCFNHTVCNSKLVLHVFCFCLSLLLLSNTIYAASFVSNTDVNANEEMRRTKAYIDDQLPQLAALDDYHKAVALRNFVYAKVNRKGPLTFAVPMTYEKILQYAAGNAAPYCGALGVEYVALLTLYGIPSHYVYMTSDTSVRGGPRKDGHIVIEVYVDGRWILQDPTFNIHWEWQGMPLSVIELAKAFADGQTPNPDSDGYPFNDMVLETYGVPYQNFLAHIVITHYFVWGDEPCAGRLAYDEYYPEEDGIEPNNFVRPVAGQTLFDYDFSDGVPEDWMISDSRTTLFSTLSPSDSQEASFIPGVDITALCRPNGYVLNLKQPLVLEPGKYQMIVDGNIKNGGMKLLLLDVKFDHIKNRSVYHHEIAQQDKPMVLSFDIERAGRYNLVLGNAAMTYGEQSRWRISKIILQSI
ncbi:MAG: transglutaminase-like domain-containing protein [Gammaproteobacteria bacterium]|nr:transglutaminase-like domain-containing protein [Gammaproteobacteria bacterium]